MFFNPSLTSRQIAKYFNRYPKDPLMLKVLVGCLFVIDLAQVISTFAFVYLYAAKYWGQCDLNWRHIWANTACCRGA